MLKKDLSMGKRLHYRKGAVTLEFLFAFLFLMVFFVIIISFEFILISRISAVHSIWRIQRVESISKSQLFINNEDGNNKNGFTRKVGFGDLVVDTLKNSNIIIQPPKNEAQDPYLADYNIALLKGLLNFYYGEESPKKSSDSVLWLEPGQPKTYEEH